MEEGFGKKGRFGKSGGVFGSKRRLFRLCEEKNLEKPEYVIGVSHKAEVENVTNVWLDYFKEKQINGVLFKALKALMAQEELPENPFVFLSNRLRISELYYSIVDEKINEFELNELEPLNARTQVTNVKGCDRIWGLKNTLNIIDAPALSELLARINFFPEILGDGESSPGAYHIRHVSALTGPSIFYGKVIPYIPASITVNEECVVSGPKFEKAVAVFANQIITEVGAAEAYDNSIIIGVHIEKTAHLKQQRSSSGDFKLWTHSKIISSRSSFVSSVKAAVVASAEIVLEFIIELPHLSQREDAADNEYNMDSIDENLKSGRVRSERGQFVQVKKNFAMHFQQSGQEIKCYSSFPFGSLCVGIFKSERDANFYAGLFTTDNGQCWTLDNRQDLHAGFRAQLKSSLVKEYIAGNLISAVELLLGLICIAKRYRVIKDLMRLMNSPAGLLHGLVAWNNHLRRVLFICREEAQQNQRFGSLHLVERVVHQFRHFREKLLSVASITDSSEIEAMHLVIRHTLCDMCDPISKRLVIDANATESKLEDVKELCEALELTVSRDMVAVLSGNAMHESSKNPTNDSEELKPDTIVALIEGVIDSSDPNASKIAPKDARNRRRSSIIDPKHQNPDLATSSSFDIFSEAGIESLEAFTNEDESLQRSDENRRIVNVPKAVKTAKKKRTVPASIAREAVLLEYLTETRVDSVIQELVVDIFFKNGKMFPNPYPRIVGRLRGEVARHELWRQSDTELQQIIPGNRARIKLVSEKYSLCKLTKANVFGIKSALRTCDGAKISQVMADLEVGGVILPKSGLKLDSRDSSAYSISICTSVGGSLSLTSKINSETIKSAQRHSLPCLLLFETHIYEGPKISEALETCVEQIMIHVMRLNDKSVGNVALDLRTGRHAMRNLNTHQGFDGGWQVQRREKESRLHHPNYSHGEILEMEDLQREKALCKQELIRALKAREPILVDLVVLFGDDKGPYYAQVTKLLGFYFVQTPAGQISSLSPPFAQLEPIYQSVWVDSSQASAVLQTTMGSIVEKFENWDIFARNRYLDLLKHRIFDNRARGDMVSAYRVLLRYSVLIENERFVADAIRMLKSPCICYDLDTMAGYNRLLQRVLRQRMKGEEFRQKLRTSTLLGIYEEYKTRIEDVLSRSDCVYFPGIRNAIHTLLLKCRNIINKDRIGTTDMHIESLERLQIFLSCIQTAAAQAVHRNCDHIETFIQTLPGYEKNPDN